MKIFFPILIIVFFTSILNGNFKDLNLTSRAGHIGVNFSIGTHIFTYDQKDGTPFYYINDNGELFYKGDNSIDFQWGIIFFSTQRHYYSFVFSDFIRFSPFETGNIEFGVIDSRFITSSFLLHNSFFAIFKGNYEFSYKGGVSYIFEIGKYNYLGIKTMLNINLNNLTIYNTLSIDWFYLF